MKSQPGCNRSEGYLLEHQRSYLLKIWNLFPKSSGYDSYDHADKMVKLTLEMGQNFVALSG